MPELLTVHDVANVCRLHEVTVRRHIASGRLRSVRVGKGIRVRPEDLDSYLQQPAAPGDRGILTKDDPLLGIIGMINDESWVSSDKYRALFETSTP